MPGRAHETAQAVDHLLVTGGLAAVTLRNIAALVGRSPAALSSHLTNRERLMRVSASIVSRARLERIESRVRTEGVGAFVPVDDDDVLATRAWLGWLELWRSDDALEYVVTEGRDHERRLLAWALDFRLERDRLDLALATIEGLRTAVCAPVAPMPVQRAQSLLGIAVRELLRRGGDPTAA
ncbi:hypothetical protein [Nocardioides sp. LHG3406-4]|uniref:hypothetical protein n=1 Tax=Nocardioides sp. LHG3406-4 TaxID=2804575 RepID=UPI003CE80C2C